MMLVKLNILKNALKLNLAEDKCLLEPYVLNGTCMVLMRVCDKLRVSNSSIGQ